ncbi:unnamed protein product [Lampetra planeri]
MEADHCGDDEADGVRVCAARCRGADKLTAPMLDSDAEARVGGVVSPPPVSYRPIGLMKVSRQAFEVEAFQSDDIRS